MKFCWALTLMLALTSATTASPTLASPNSFTVDTQSRKAVTDFYHSDYEITAPPPMGFTGNVNACQPGDTSQAFKAQIARRINYFRAMAGVPAGITLSDASNHDAQAAALMMSANASQSHSPPPSWRCYTQAGADGAGNGNLFLGTYGWNAIDGYILDPGDGNGFVGHRRWILHPATQQMGTGDIPDADNQWAANSLSVFDDHIFDSRPATRDGFVAWPPPGFVPYQVTFARWSLSYANADFSTASVRMTLNSAAIPLTQETVVDGFGENTLVWRPYDMANGATWHQPANDEKYSVSVDNVVLDGVPRSFAYDVTVADLTQPSTVARTRRAYAPVVVNGR